MEICLIDNRVVIEVTGNDKYLFLNNILSNDINKLVPNALIYALMLSPQGKYLCDFYIFQDDSAIYLDVPKDLTEQVIKKFKIYKLRSDVSFKQTDIQVYFTASKVEAKAYKDPRLEGFGFRAYSNTLNVTVPVEYYEKRRIDFALPEYGRELLVEKSFPLEYGLDNLGAIDFKKGCYIGQEVTARTKYRGVVRKSIYNVSANFDLQEGDLICNGMGYEIGKVTSAMGNKAMAIIRYVDTDITMPKIADKDVTLTKAAWYKNGS